MTHLDKISLIVFTKIWAERLTKFKSDETHIYLGSTLC